MKDKNYRIKINMRKKYINKLIILFFLIGFFNGCSTFKSVKNTLFFWQKKKRVITAEDVEIPESSKK